LSSDHAKRFYHNCLHALSRRSFFPNENLSFRDLTDLSHEGTKVSFEASKFASYYPSCFVVRVVAALFDFLLLKFVVPNMKRKIIFVGLFDAGLS